MKITHWGISYFRSIGENPVMLDLTKKINVLAGANNSGKSNVLRGLMWYGDNHDSTAPTDFFRREKEPLPKCKLICDVKTHSDNSIRQLGELQVYYTPHRTERHLRRLDLYLFFEKSALTRPTESTAKAS